MINLTKYIDNFIIELTGIDKQIHRWSNEGGQGNYLHSIDIKKINKTFNLYNKDIENIGSIILKHLKKHFNKIEEKDLFTSYSGDNIQFKFVEDENCKIINNKEDYKEEMFLCDYFINIRINEIDFDSRDFIKIFPDGQF